MCVVLYLLYKRKMDSASSLISAADHQWVFDHLPLSLENKKILIERLVKERDEKIEEAKTAETEKH